MVGVAVFDRIAITQCGKLNRHRPGIVRQRHIGTTQHAFGNGPQTGSVGHKPAQARDKHRWHVAVVTDAVGVENRQAIGATEKELARARVFVKPVAVELPARQPVGGGEIRKLPRSLIQPGNAPIGADPEPVVVIDQNTHYHHVGQTVLGGVMSKPPCFPVKSAHATRSAEPDIPCFVLGYAVNTFVELTGGVVGVPPVPGKLPCLPVEGMQARPKRAHPERIPTVFKQVGDMVATQRFGVGRVVAEVVKPARLLIEPVKAIARTHPKAARSVAVHKPDIRVAGAVGIGRVVPIIGEASGFNI